MIFSSPPKNGSWLQLRISERRWLLMAGDAISIVIAVYASLAIWVFVDSKPLTLEFVLSQIFWFGLFSVVWFILASANDFYDLQIASSLTASVQRLGLMQLQMLLLYLGIYFLSEPESLPRLFVIYYGLLSFGLITVWRFLSSVLIGWEAFQRRVLVVGTNWAANEIIHTIKADLSGTYAIVGVIGEKSELGKRVNGSEVVGSGQDILELVIEHNISELILSSTHGLNSEVFQGVMDAYERGAIITPMPLLYERMTGRVPVEGVNDNWTVILPIGQAGSLGVYPTLKRLLDLTIALLLIPLFLLVLPVAALLIKLDSRGSIFYRQTRIGLHGKPFRIVKFRTMVPHAEATTGAVFAQKNDPRVTRFGGIMRRTRIDELPQLFNVLKNEMSLIGPRPERPEHVSRLEKQIPFYRTRHIIRPGLTGWAQVRYQYGSTDEDAMVKLQYDFYYIRHQSLVLDINILIRTLGNVLQMKGR